MRRIIKGIENDEVMAAFTAAMAAPHPHERSPALALQIAYKYTKKDFESEEDWVLRFTKMTGDEFSNRIGWHRDENCWSPYGDHIVDGKSIMENCVYWHKNDRDFSRYPDDYFTYDQEKWLVELDGEVINRVQRGLIPIPGEIIRRSWRTKKGTENQNFHFDIIKFDDIYFEWCLKIASENGKELEIASGTDEFWRIEGFIAPAVIPKRANRIIINQVTKEKQHI